MEFGFLVTAQPIAHEERPHKHFPSSVRSNCIGPVSLPDREALWQATYLQKKKIYGSSGIIAVGGKDGDDHGETEASRQRPRNNDTVEPVAFGAESVEYYEDVIDWFRTTGCVKEVLTLDFARCGCMGRTPQISEICHAAPPGKSKVGSSSGVLSMPRF